MKPEKKPYPYSQIVGFSVEHLSCNWKLDDRYIKDKTMLCIPSMHGKSKKYSFKPPYPILPVSNATHKQYTNKQAAYSILNNVKHLHKGTQMSH